MFGKVLLPKEHGSWAMLAVPLFLGLVIAPVWHWRGLILPVAALGFFLMRYPLVLLVKSRKRTGPKPHLWRWAAIYGTVTALSGGWLVIGQELWGLLLLGLLGVAILGVNLWLVARRQEMSAGGELAGIAGLALSAPMAYYAASGTLDRTAAVLGLINALYFGGTVFYIKLKVRQQPRLPAPEQASKRLVKAKACLAYQSLVLSLIILLVTLRQAPALVPLAFVPATVKIGLGAWQWQDKRSLNIVRLGVTEVVHAVAFAALVVVTF